MRPRTLFCQLPEDTKHSPPPQPLLQLHHLQGGCLGDAFPQPPNRKGPLERQSPAAGHCPTGASTGTDRAAHTGPQKAFVPLQSARSEGEPRRLFLQEEDQLLCAISVGSPKMSHRAPAGSRPLARTPAAIHTHFPSKNPSLFSPVRLEATGQEPPRQHRL